MSVNLSALDFVALIWFLTAWLGYAPFVRWKGGRYSMVAAVMVGHRRAWMHSLLGRDVKVADTAIIGHIMSTAAFFASTSVVVVGALLGVLINLQSGVQSGAGFWHEAATRSPLEIKLAMMFVVAVYAFLSFTWAIRQANFGAVMIGAAPAPPIAPALRERLAESMAKIITSVAQSYDNGMRAYYFALGAVTWFVHPLLFISVTGGVVALLLARQAGSGTALALQEIAAARDEDLATGANREGKA
jgi:uncharacterized membrane protein